MAHVLEMILTGLLLIVDISFIAIVVSQTTKNEGLSGTIGGNVTSSFKGKPGTEENIKAITLYLGVAWFVLSVLVAILGRYQA